MTVRQVERLAARPHKVKSSRAPFHPDANTKAAIDELQRIYGTRVLIQPSLAGNPGRLIFEYYDDSDLARLYDQMTGH
jgi:hypothetical protein